MDKDIQNESKSTLTIKGLLGQYYFEIDFQKPLSVLIGENGCGKTTILKIIESIGNKDFIELSRYMFEKIILRNNDEVFEINYVDLIPNPEIIIQNLQGDLILDMRSDEFPDIANGFNEMISKNKFKYALFMAKCFYDEPMGGHIIHYIPTVCLNTLTPGIDYCIEYKNSLKKLIRIDKGIRFFQGSQIADLVIEFSVFFENSYLSRHKVISLDLINNTKLVDEPLTKPFVKANKLKILNEFIDEYVTKMMRDFNKDIKQGFIRFFEQQKYENQIREEFAPIINFLNGSIEIELMNKEELFEIAKLSLGNEHILNVNEVLTRFYYSDEFIKSMNNKASQILVNGNFDDETIDLNSPELDFKFFTPEVLENIRTYMVPVFPVESIMGNLCDKVTTWYMTSDFTFNEIVALEYFYSANIDEFINEKSDEIKNFESIVNSYLNNKKIFVFPNGVKVIVNNSTKKDKGKYELITNESNHIRLMDLSSGERKIILTFLISTFFDESTILIDEPELSISILWQEKLLDNIIYKAKSKHVIIATHSPFIINERIIKESVITLPMEVYDE